MSKPKSKKPKKTDMKAPVKKGKSKTGGLSPPGLERQSSNDYPEWYHTVPDDDVWGEDPEDPWGDGEKPKTGKTPKKTGDVEDDWGPEEATEDAGEGGDAEEGDDWGDIGAASASLEKTTTIVKTPYRILDAKSIGKKRDNFIAEQADLLGLSKTEMDLLLRYLRYDKKKIDLFLNDRKNQAEVRLQSGIRGEGQKAKPTTSKTVQCAAWCSVVPVSEAHCLDCGHYLCNDCWQGFLKSEISAGVVSVFSKCPAQDEKGEKCREAVDYKTMKKYLGVEELDKLDRWILDQFVECSTNLKWCPKAGCTWAAEYDGGDAIDVLCKCGESFCFHCLTTAHSPAPCDLAKKWSTLNDDSDAASERLIQSLTKPCPKCGTRIEKNRHCNHMKCSKCNFDFCWQCMQEIKIGVTHPSWYVCKNREAQAEGKLAKEEEDRLNLNKFLTKLSLHKQHVEDCQKDRKAANGLLPKISAVEGTMSDGRTLNWLTSIAKQISESHRFLEWSWVYSYFMADSSRKETFVNWQKILEEKADGMLHDLEKALNKPETFPAFLAETKRITEIKKSVEILTSKMQQMSELADEIAAVLQHEADVKTAQWSCLRCQKQHEDKEKDSDKRITHCPCGACRAHGDLDCLVVSCKKS